MGRDFQIAGECLVSVKGPSNSAIASLTQLGLTAEAINVQHVFRHKDINVDAWGGPEGAPADVQWMLGWVVISMTLIHYDPVILGLCHQLGMGGAILGEGTTGRAGQRLGNNLPRFAAGNNLIGLNISSPVSNRPWRFWYTYVMAPPAEWPIGTEKSVLNMTWRAIPYTQDPWGGTPSQPNTNPGTGALGAIIYDRTLDS